MALPTPLAPSSPSTRPLALHPLATLTPPSSSRLWQSAPHPTLPLLATASADKTVRISSLSTFAQLSTVSGGHKRSVRSVAWKPGSGPARAVRRFGREVKGTGESVLVTGSFDASAGIWRRWEGGEHTVPQEEAGGGEVEQDFTGRGQGGGDKGDNEDEEWAFAVVLDGHDSEIKSVAYSPVGPFLATCSRDKSVWIWEELEDDNFETVAVLQEHEGDVKCVAWHPEEVMVASGSYDDSVRLWREEGEGEDWGCAAVLEGFGGTVWGVEFEPGERVGVVDGEVRGEDGKELLDMRKEAGARLVTCCDDKSIKIWRRIPKEKKEMPTGRSKMPSILKTHSIAEEWVEEATLPEVHERAVYAVNWSRQSGRIVSCGSDGRVVVFEERWRESRDADGDTSMQESGTAENGDAAVQATSSLTEWVVVAELENAHDVFEVNHVTWAPRADKGKQSEDEEIVVSTGDDGEVKVWTLSPAI
ncbi:WD domain-containing protein 40 [Elsinoe australis]|uniref:Probable cytosolic iron-sulfur protein assembly protein 1 n=1 Tax=Elsinoe australis TaxID=40998 RepID=A0A4U7ASZ7_9PEZI|nr:WD domain-containing protein 40 [Elsinoe australis]